ncbi:MAG: FAD:protein FMN transferase [Chloroflexota bacterium]|nr:FAD:protein FMN transferase [Chloroflexota bacterium]
MDPVLEVTPGTTGVEPGHIERIEFRAMGSQILAAVESDDVQAAAMLAQVPAWFEEWEQALSRFRRDSDLSILNNTSAPDSPVIVSPLLWELLRLALEAAALTGGLVTPTLLNALEDAGYKRSFQAMSRDGQGREDNGREVTIKIAGPHTDSLFAAANSPSSSSSSNSSDFIQAPGDWHNIKTYAANRSVALPLGVRIDLGGIAKGWAADTAAARLSRYGPALVDAGGDVAVIGPRRDGSGWLVGVDAPSSSPGEPGEQTELLSVDSGGIATSGTDYRRWRQGDEWRHHIIDPRTGKPSATGVVSATVVAPTTREAEVAAKVALLLGSEYGLDWLEARPNLAGLLVLENGKVVRTSRLREYLWSTRYGHGG